MNELVWYLCINDISPLQKLVWIGNSVLSSISLLNWSTICMSLCRGRLAVSLMHHDLYTIWLHYICMRFSVWFSCSFFSSSTDEIFGYVPVVDQRATCIVTVYIIISYLDASTTLTTTLLPSSTSKSTTTILSTTSGSFSVSDFYFTFFLL